VVIDNFFVPAKGDEIHSCFPAPDKENWDATTYIDQKNKFQKSIQEDFVLKKVFDELNGEPFRQWLLDITHIEEPLLADEHLFGAGLHQSVGGAFLNVHVDYNIHPVTKFHRRLNLLVYLNKNWKDEYEGHLELWDFTEGKKQLLEKISPVFNRCVIFETNEISYHGHPKPLKVPAGESRKSLAVYYYTKNRPIHECAPNHNTRFVNTEGWKGQWKRFTSGVIAFFERMKWR
jgi:Rps23 Pro-64 3,4-dihydroxylase Tpa1-like proline 4-hydroxylase